MEFKKHSNFDQLYFKVMQQIETYNDKPNPPGGNNIQHTDAGSITGNQCKFTNAPPTTDIGSLTGNQCKTSTDIGSITGNCTGKTTNEQVQCGAAALTTSAVLGPATPNQSQSNFCTANQQNQPQHTDTNGINTSDIKQMYHPCLPYKKIKSKKINRKYPLFSRFK